VAAQQIARESGRQLIGIATVCGAPDDPQGYTQQRQILQEHGFILAESNAQAVRLAIAALGRHSAEQRAAGVELPSQEAWDQEAWEPPASEAVSPAVPEHLSSLFDTGPRVINVGVALFAEQLAICGVPVVHVNWRPPAGGDMRLARLLERLR
jgi:FdrA protein